MSIVVACHFLREKNLEGGAVEGEVEILGKLEIKKREQTPFQVLLKRLLRSGPQVRDKVPLTKSRGEHQTHFGLHIHVI